MLDQRTVEELARRFNHHPPQGDQAERYERIRAGCLDLAKLVCELAPDSRERSAALTFLDSVMFFANAAIARNRGAAQAQS